MEGSSPPPPETVRIHQANERTLLAWLRTGIALMAFGFAIARFGLFLRQLAVAGGLLSRGPTSLGSASLGTALVALGMVTNLLATIRYRQVRRAVERGDVGAPDGLLPYLIGATLTVVGAVMATLLARSIGE